MGELRIRGGISADAAGGDEEGDDGFEDGLLIANFVGEVMSWTIREHSITAGDSLSPFISRAGRRMVVVVVVGSAISRCSIVAFLLSLCPVVVGMVTVLVCSTIGSTPVLRSPSRLVVALPAPVVAGDKLLALVVRSFLLLGDFFVE